MLETAQQVLGHLREQGRMLNRLLERLALAESPSAEPRAQYEMLDILSEALVEIGYAAWRARTQERWPPLRAARRPRTTPQCNSCSDTATPSGRSGRLG